MAIAQAPDVVDDVLLPAKSPAEVDLRPPVKTMPKIVPKIVPIGTYVAAANQLKEIVREQGPGRFIDEIPNKHTGAIEKYVKAVTYKVLARILNLRVELREVQEVVSDDRVVRYVAIADIYNADGARVNWGQASCDNTEPRRQNASHSSLAGMAQTRAFRRALQNELGDVLTLAGYDAPPSEEMFAAEMAVDALPPASGAARDGDAAGNGQERRAFAIAGALRPHLEEHGVSEDDLWNYARERAGVASRADMGATDWQTLANTFGECQDEARNPLPDRIATLADRVKASASYSAPHRQDVSKPRQVEFLPETASESPTDAASEGPHITSRELDDLLDDLDVADYNTPGGRQTLLRLASRARQAYDATGALAVERMGELRFPITGDAFDANLVIHVRELSDVTADAVGILARLCVEEERWEDGVRADVVALWADVRTATAPAQRNAVGQPEIARMADPSGLQVPHVATAGRVT